MLTLNSSGSSVESFHEAVHCALRLYGVVHVHGLSPDSLESFAGAFGRLVPQYGCKTSFSVRYTPEEVNTYDSLSKTALFAHTDGHDLDVPPEMVVLGCVRQAADSGGHTEVSDSRVLLSQLSSEERNLFSFKQAVGMFPIWDNVRATFRFSTIYLRKQSETDLELGRLVKRVLEFHEAEKQAIRLSAGDALIFDNHRMLHSRREFDDTTRHLVRIWISRRTDVLQEETS